MIKAGDKVVWDVEGKQSKIAKGCCKLYGKGPLTVEGVCWHSDQGVVENVGCEYSVDLKEVREFWQKRGSFTSQSGWVSGALVKKVEEQT